MIELTGVSQTFEGRQGRVEALADIHLVALAVIGAVIGEFVGADAGLGHLVVQSQASAGTTLAFAAIALLGALSIVMFYLVVAAERWLVPGAEEHR